MRILVSQRLLGVGVLVLVSCASGSGISEAELPYALADGQMVVSCGGQGGFPVSILPHGIETSQSTAIREALTQHRIEAGIDAASAIQESNGDEVAWSVLTSSDEGMLLALGSWSTSGPGEDGSVLWLAKHGDVFRVESWGGCSLSPVLAHPGMLWVEIAAPDADPLSSQLQLDLAEGACLSGRDPDDFLNEPIVVETPESVTVFWTSSLTLDPGEELQDLSFACPSNPIVTRTLELDEPLGNRVVLDGSTWPASDVTGVRISNDFSDLLG